MKVLETGNHAERGDIGCITSTIGVRNLRMRNMAERCLEPRQMSGRVAVAGTTKMLCIRPQRGEAFNQEA